jgi:hypothetical protein
MLAGPLSDWIDSIVEKPPFFSIKKESSKITASSSPHLKSLQSLSQNPQELWDVTQINCPIPPRCPDRWMS